MTAFTWTPGSNGNNNFFWNSAGNWIPSGVPGEVPNTNNAVVASLTATGITNSTYLSTAPP